MVSDYLCEERLGGVPMPSGAWLEGEWENGKYAVIRIPMDYALQYSFPGSKMYGRVTY